MNSLTSEIDPSPIMPEPVTDWALLENLRGRGLRKVRREADDNFCLVSGAHDL